MVKKECRGSVDECLAWDQGVAGLSLTRCTVLCPWARHFILYLELVQPKKTHSNRTIKIVDWEKELKRTNIETTIPINSSKKQRLRQATKNLASLSIWADSLKPCLPAHARIQRGGGGQSDWTTHLKNHKNIGFLSNTGPDPLENHKATKQAFNVGSSSAHQQNTI